MEESLKPKGDTSSAAPFCLAYTKPGILKDGLSVRIRSITEGDASSLLALFTSLSDTSVYPRYFSPSGGRSLPNLQEMEILCSPIPGREVAIVATVEELGNFKVIGISRCARDYASPSRATLTLAVHEAWHGRGVGTLLLEHIAELAKHEGIQQFEGFALGQNKRILEVLRASGLRGTRVRDGEEVRIEMSTEATSEFQRASTDREMKATARSLEPFFTPSSVAVIGASKRQGSIGHALVANLLEGAFPGRIYPINPKPEPIAGLSTYPSVEVVPAAVDLAIIAVHAPDVEATVGQCIRKGVKAVVVVSSGLAEVSNEGREIEQRITESARTAGMRLLGPNCMGLLNTDPACPLYGVFAGKFPPAGDIGMISQSGALGLAILDYVSIYNLGISNFISIGNRADVSVNDLLSFWAYDDRTSVIALYLESFGNPDKFARIARKVAREKPIVAVKSGRTNAGSRAASSHSASLASVDVAVDALFRQAGVIRTDTLEELFDIAKVLSSQPLPSGGRVGVVTNAGGPGILLADALEVRGLELPALSASTIEQLKAILPFQAGLANPIDMLAYADGALYEQVIRVVGSDANVDSVVVIYVPPVITDPHDISAGIARAAGEISPDKPLLTVFLSSSEKVPGELHSGARGRIPVFTFPENAAKALSEVEKYARWRKKSLGEPYLPTAKERQTVRGIIDGVLAENSAAQWLEPDCVYSLLRGIGIRAANEWILRGPEEVELAASSFSYPLVLKVISPDVLHKSDEGGVVLGIKDDVELFDAFERMRKKVSAGGARIEGFLLQEEIQEGREFLVGVTRDPVFGHLIVTGLGGIYVELFKDVSFSLPPVSNRDAGEMIEKLKSKKLLDGFRGNPALDREALEDVIMRISALVEVAPEIRELDLNPVKVLPRGKGAVVVDARIRIGAI